MPRRAPQKRRPMPRTQSPQRRRVLITGMRKAGTDAYNLKVYGNPASAFPPLLIKMSLHELQQWLHELQTVPPPDRGERPRLRIVS